MVINHLLTGMILQASFLPLPEVWTFGHPIFWVLLYHLFMDLLAPSDNHPSLWLINQPPLPKVFNKALVIKGNQRLRNP